MIIFDPHHDAALLQAAGYTYEFIEASWQDIGGPENGPKLSGHPDLHIYTLTLADRPYTQHVIVVDDNGEIIECDYQPTPPAGWEDQFPDMSDAQIMRDEQEREREPLFLSHIQDLSRF